MLKVIGAVVVYGLALYGLLEAIEKLDARWDERPSPKRAKQATGDVKEAVAGVSDPDPARASAT